MHREGMPTITASFTPNNGTCDCGQPFVQESERLKCRACVAEEKLKVVREAVEKIWDASDPLLRFVNAQLPHPEAGPARVDFVNALHALMAASKP